MKTFFATLIIGFLLISCDKDCEYPTDVCKERPPTNELCEAAFNTWFYNEETNSCEQIGYSGCNAYGFATKSECEACICNY